MAAEKFVKENILFQSFIIIELILLKMGSFMY